METGNDGRFYDWHYDYNNNGQLETGVLCCMPHSYRRVPDPGDFAYCYTCFSMNKE